MAQGVPVEKVHQFVEFLVKQHGGITQAARASGVPKSTFGDLVHQRRREASPENVRAILKAVAEFKPRKWVSADDVLRKRMEHEVDDTRSRNIVELSDQVEDFPERSKVVAAK